MGTAPAIGSTISHYRITERLGAGGMGVVYRAGDMNLQRDMALKFLPDELAADPGARKRLVKEAQAASRLNHPNIATIYEVDESHGTPFIAMELVNGESLKDVLRRGPLPPQKLLEIARQIAEGLHEAHQGGILHRDIKPGNIMVDTKGRVKILDFGLAALTGQERKPGEPEENFITRTATQWSTGGTVPYMSPEQLRGESADVRSDIFSFGAMLYECLTGQLPFPGETSIDIMQAILRRPHTPVRTRVPDISSEWEDLVARCLAKAPEQRPQSMAEVLDTLKQAAAPAPRAEKSLAVLYFENPGGSKEDEYFRDGITEDVITELSKIKDLWVFTRSAVAAYRDKSATAPQVGRELNAAYVLEGSLRRAGNRLRITARLVETSTARSVWAERYDRQLEDVFAIQDEIAQNIAKALQVMLTETEKRAIHKAPTTDVQAYDYYLRGRQFFYRFNPKGFDFARQMFARAIVIDPAYARAYAGVADCCSFLYMYFECTDANLKEADAASRKALELDPELADAHASRGLSVLLNKRYEEAEKEFDTAIRLDPRLYQAYYFRARACVSQGKLQEAAHWFEEACRVNPEDYQAPILLGSVYKGLNRESDAHDVRRRALSLTERHLELYPEDARAYYLGATGWAAIGDRKRALEWAERALNIDPNDPSVLYNVACNYALLGESEKAIECLEKTLVHGEWYKGWAEHDSDLDSIRAHPRFQAIMKAI
jgi:serine/threonine protein kinase/Tfp pilus assembly protein PilF